MGNIGCQSGQGLIQGSSYLVEALLALLDLFLCQLVQVGLHVGLLSLDPGT